MTEEEYYDKQEARTPKFIKTFMGYSEGRDGGYPEQKRQVFDSFEDLATAGTIAGERIYVVIESDMKSEIDEFRQKAEEERRKAERKKMEAEYERLKRELGK